MQKVFAEAMSTVSKIGAQEPPPDSKARSKLMDIVKGIQSLKVNVAEAVDDLQKVKDTPMNTRSKLETVVINIEKQLDAMQQKLGK